MKLRNILLMAALSLTMSAFTVDTGLAQAAKSANITISSLPFDITAPGTYVLAGNLSPSVPNVPAITISTALTGPVVLDLKGFTITAFAAPNQFQSLISLGFQQSAGNTFPITIKNGTLQTAAPGIAFGPTAISNGDNPGVALTDVTIDKVVINGRGGSLGIFFNGVAFSTISNCTFIGNMGIAIFDRSALGNVYLNDTFEGPDVNIRVAEDNMTLSRASFSGSPTGAATTATALAASAKRISSLPFNITEPGNYALTGNLDVPTAGGINISTGLAGPVILDLKGFTLLGNLQFQPTAISIGTPLSTGVANTFPITVRNGTVKNCFVGLSAAAGANPFFLSNLTIRDIDFIRSNVFFQRVNSSTVSGCTFDFSEFTDAGSSGGNRYMNDIFLSPVAFVVSSRLDTTTVDRCVFADTRPNSNP